MGCACKRCLQVRSTRACELGVPRVAFSFSVVSLVRSIVALSSTLVSACQFSPWKDGILGRRAMRSTHSQLRAVGHGRSVPFSSLEVSWLRDLRTVDAW